MLYSGLRLGSLSLDLKHVDFRKTALEMTAAAAIAGASVLACFPANAQQATNPQVLTDAQCKTAVGVTIATMQRFEGRLSVPLLKSFAAFMKGCDLTTKFDRVPGSADDEAWAEFRLKLTSIRAAEASKPVSLAAQ